MVFAVETTVSTVAAKKAGKWYRGVLYAAGRFMAIIEHKDEADISRHRYASVVGGALGNGKGAGNNRKVIAADKSRKKTADRVARFQSDYRSQSPAGASNATLLYFGFIFNTFFSLLFS